jgi:hypothetical protein
MSTMPATAVPASGSHLRSLGLIETKRLARHPVFLVGFLANAGFLVALLGDSTFDYYNIAILPGFFVGLFSAIAMFRLTRSMERAQPAVDSTPASDQSRVLALCSAAVLPALVGLVSFVAILLFQGGSEAISYGKWGKADQVAILFGETVMACVGGPLLGVAVGRWWRFPGAPAALFIGLLFWVLLGEGVTSGDRDATWTTAVRLTSPWTQFTSVESEAHEVESWRGSPWFHLGWIGALTVLAVLGALLEGAEGERRQRLFRTGALIGVVGLGFLVLAVLLGPDHATLLTRNGVGHF